MGRRPESLLSVDLPARHLDGSAALAPRRHSSGTEFGRQPAFCLPALPFSPRRRPPDAVRVLSSAFAASHLSVAIRRTRPPRRRFEVGLVGFTDLEAALVRSRHMLSGVFGRSLL